MALLSRLDFEATLLNSVKHQIEVYWDPNEKDLYCSVGCLTATVAEWRKNGLFYLANKLYGIQTNQVDAGDYLAAMLHTRGQAHKEFDKLLDRAIDPAKLTPGRLRQVKRMQAALISVLDVVVPLIYVPKAARKGKK